MDLTLGHWDEELEEARAQLKLAKREEEKARAAHTEVKLHQEREERLSNAARKKAQNAKSLEAQSRQRSNEAKRKAEDAGRKGLAKHRWEGELQRWSGEQQRASGDARRFEDEARRKEREATALAKELKVKQEIVGEKLKSTHGWSQKFNYLLKTSGTRTDAKMADQATVASDGTDTADESQIEPTLTPEVEPVEESSASVVAEAAEIETQAPPDGSTEGEQPIARPPTDGNGASGALQSQQKTTAAEPVSSDLPSANSLTITNRATAALRDILLGMGHRREELLRLSTGPDGGIVVALDSHRVGDHVVDHDGDAVLLIDRTLPEELVGKTLDTNETRDGKQLVLL